MNNKTALLPSGFYDLLGEDALRRDHALYRVMEYFSSAGYERVSPPLVEFENTLLSGGGAALDAQTFRVLDPISHQMMAVRADMTTQVSRIATARLTNLPKPLRLAYAGDVLSVKANGRDMSRQRTQAGIEIIGTNSIQADAEVILTMLEALAVLGIKEVTVDLSLPRLTYMIMESYGLERAAQEKVQRLLDKKDLSTLSNYAGKATDTLVALTHCGASAHEALTALRKQKLPKPAKQLADDFAGVIDALHTAAPNLNLTADLVEYRGFEYHSGLCFSLFSTVQSTEIVRGGRYVIQNDQETQEAVGGTLYVDSLLKLLPASLKRKKLYVPFGTSHSALRTLREEGTAITVCGLEKVKDPSKEAKRLGCDAVWEG